MFQRREPKTLFKKFCDFMWPSIGWQRSLLYVKHRVVRLSDSTHKVAGGLAIGVSISFTPLVGTHFIQAAGLSFFLRFNMLAAIIGTFVGNPWTFPFMWWISIVTGTHIFNALGLTQFIMPIDQLDLSMLGETLRLFAEVTALAFKTGFYYTIELIGLGGASLEPLYSEMSDIWGRFSHNFYRIFMPWLVGGYTLGVITWLPSYLIFYQFVKGAKVARMRAKRMKAHRVAKEVTGQNK